MAAEEPTFTCACFYVDNIFVSKYKLHLSYVNKNIFMKKYAQILRKRGCVTTEQVEGVVAEIETEITRRKFLGLESLRREAEITKRYRRLHDEVYHLKEHFLDPAFLDIVSQARTANSIHSVLPLLEKLDEGVFRLPVFTSQFCSLMLEEIETIESSDCPKGRPNTMNNSGILLNEFGFDAHLLDPLRQRYIAPITSLLFADHGGACLDSHKAFTVTYQLGRDLDLSCHFDNSEVTLNVALGYDFSGGDLFFQSMKDDLASKESSRAALRVQHRPGWGLLHCGAHMHGADRLLSGKRCNLIVWMRASVVRNAVCPMCRRQPQLVQTPGVDDGFRIQGQGTAEMVVPRQQEVDVCHVV